MQFEPLRQLGELDMYQLQWTIGQKIARAASAFEKWRTKGRRKWITVFMNDDTIVVALHGLLSAAEKSLAQSAIGAAQVQTFHRHLFADVSATLVRKIKRLTGMNVRHTRAEIEPQTGSVVQLFTSDTVAADFLGGRRELGEDRAARNKSVRPGRR